MINNNIPPFIYYPLIFILQMFLSDCINLGPFIYLCLLPLMILSFPSSLSTNRTMLAAFGLGLLLDILCDGVMGLNAAACVALAASKKSLNTAFLNKDGFDHAPELTSNVTDKSKYIYYIVISTSLYLLTYILLDCAGTRPFFFILVRFVCSLAANTVISLLIISSVRKKS